MKTMIEVDRMDGHAFEYFCAQLLAANGFSNIHVTKASGDQGVDIVATKDEIKYAIQCKCYSGKLGNKPIQEVYAGKTYYRCDKAVVMTNSSFTSGACSLANATNVVLWDRNRLQQMLDVFNGNAGHMGTYAYGRLYTQQTYYPEQQTQKERIKILLNEFFMWAKIICISIPVLAVTFTRIGIDGFIFAIRLISPFILPFVVAGIMHVIGWLILGKDVNKCPTMSLCAYVIALTSFLYCVQSEHISTGFWVPSAIIIAIEILKFALIQVLNNKR